MGQRSALRAIPILVAFFALIAIAWGVRYDWPDNVHVRHGLPLTWGTHTLVTIAGPANIWRVDFVNLILDLVLWLALITASYYIFWMRGAPGGSPDEGINRTSSSENNRWEN
jgi:hypothetical protein